MSCILKSLVATLCGYFIVGTSSAAEPVSINFDAENPPFMYIKNGKAAGIYPEAIAAAMAAMGVTVTLDAKPWKRALAEIDDGKSGIGGIYKNAERVQKYDFSDPFLTENIAVYFNKSKPIDFKTLADLHGKKIGVIRGWSYGDAFDTARKTGTTIHVEEVNGDRANLMKLSEGRLDAVLSIEESGQAIIAEAKLTNIGQSKIYLASNKVHLAFNKTARQAELLAKFNKTIAAMKQNGSLDRIVLKELVR